MNPAAGTPSACQENKHKNRLGLRNFRERSPDYGTSGCYQANGPSASGKGTLQHP
ncbi:hypothetical protein JZ751_002771 [Albula glossodonta]|uniref:Uncharacterized protein n=1 Tax=Albula glossodonta TaxID=121402 RepID=A0A8T2N8Z9_9TELE|nr:hypothetical protein JZ751_002771 [Albula glossodonta]